LSPMAPVDIDPYLLILRSLVPAAQSIAVYWANGKPLAKADSESLAELQLCAGDLLVAMSSPDSPPRRGTRHTIGGAPAYVLVLRDDKQAMVGAVGLICAPTPLTARTPSVDDVAQVAQAALVLLARELSTRSAAGTATPSEAEPPAEETPAGEQIAADDTVWDNIIDQELESLLTQLPCDSALLYLPARGLRQLKTQPADTPEQRTFIEELTRRHLFGLATASGELLVANKLRETAGGPLLPYRILALPLKNREVVVGMLAVFRRREQPQFRPENARPLERLPARLHDLLTTSFDEHTGLLTRQHFELLARQNLDAAPAKSRCVVYGDLDRMHSVNELFGFTLGDAVLRGVANLWRGTELTAGSLVCRLSGDRFVALLEHTTLNQARSWAERLREAIQVSQPPEGCAGLHVTASFGVAGLAGDQTLTFALAAAETACKAAKDRGRNRVELFAATDASLMRRHEDLHVFREVIRALDAGRFELLAQPLVPLGDPSRPTHYEILVRLLDGENHLISPDNFLSAATRYQLLARLDQWVVQEALSRLSAHREALKISPTRFWINLSGQGLGQEDFGDFARTAVKSAGLPPGLIGFEITENAAIGNLQIAKQFISRLRELGCEFALDDFGTGLSSLSYLKDLQVSMLKIDGSFIREVLKDPRTDSLVRATVQIAQQLDLQTTAECIETPQLRAYLASLGITYGQGYALGHPKPLNEVIRALVGTASPTADTGSAPRLTA
jgi:diguanylate cyclase (GGDEF)-like protein